MLRNFSLFVFFLQSLLMFSCLNTFGQEVPIVGYEIDSNGLVQLTVNSSTSNYYVLKVRNDTLEDFDLLSSITLGDADSTIISESLSAYPVEHYQVLEFSISSPEDADEDGLDDLTEFNDIPFRAPLNAAGSLDIAYGTVVIDNLVTYDELAIVNEEVQWAEYLNGRSFVKFLIEDFNTTHPKIYFINSVNYSLHQDFANAVNIDFPDEDIRKGEIIFHPNTPTNNGIGTFTFNYSNGFGDSFETVQRTQELLAANMPLLKNNLAYFVTANAELAYTADYLSFQNSRVSVLLESELYADIDFWLLNQAEGYGLFTQVGNNEEPGAREVVLYESLPNTLPRVSGIMTSTFQSPLSHINLRAIQNNIPNAYVRDPLSVDSISSLLGKYVYYKVGNEQLTIREATLEEVNEWFESIRPEGDQIPALDLSYTSVLPLDQIDFHMSSAFGAKCTNVAVMRQFGFKEGTIPNGYGVPFYYYQEFMKHNGFFETIRTLIMDPMFDSDRDFRITVLENLRNEIKDGTMPQWMLNELQVLQNEFPQGTSIRCRSSTNNEDLPGFSGAGLYTSKTQHPNEGHIAKSIKQVYASMWNLRAFEEREFYRVDHFVASMGILCHSNYSNEKANGVGVSYDPLYESENTFYLNSQKGEELITNPGFNMIPEEILLFREKTPEEDFIIVRRSNLSTNDSLIMEPNYLYEMREILSVIHDEFKVLYNVQSCELFAMDIEYKITSDDQLIVKQARPWVFNSSDAHNYGESSEINVLLYPNPSDDYINIACENCAFGNVRIVNFLGGEVLRSDVSCSEGKINISDLYPGAYILQGYSFNTEQFFSKKFVVE